MFYLSTSWFNTTQKLNLVYKQNFRENPKFDFKRFSTSLYSAPAPTIVLFRHAEHFDMNEKLPYSFSVDDHPEKHVVYHHFGFYCGT